jgi:hypothetical protein
MNGEGGSDNIQSSKLLLAHPDTVVLGFGTCDLVYVHFKTIFVFGNEVFSLTRGGVCLSE